MISVLSRQQPLNGSRFVLLILLASLTFSACGIFMPTQKPTPHKKTSPQKARKKVDTVSWKKIPSQEKPPIKTDDSASETEVIYSEKKAQYNASLFLPFKASHYRFESMEDERNQEHLRFIHFYAGLKLALEDINRYENKIELHVFDTEGSNSIVSGLMREKVNREADVYIGPYDRNALITVSRNSKAKKIPLISPWQASSKITTDNPYYIQIRPDLQDHYTRMLDHALESFPEDQIVILSTNKKSDENRTNYIQNSAKAKRNSNESVLQEFIVSLDSLELGDTAFDSLFMKHKNPVVIIPNWSFKDKDYILSCLRRLNVEKGNQQIHVYGMPILLEQENMDFDFFTGLHLKICRSKFVRREHPEVDRFKRKFYNVYGALPTDDAYEGYDIMKFVGKNLIKHGKNFHYFLDTDSEAFMQSAYRIERDYPEGDDRFERINYFKNKHLDIIQFVDGSFQVISELNHE